MRVKIGGDGFGRRCTVTDGKVYCRYGSTTGYSVRDARPGHWLTWQDAPEGEKHYGRVLGRIASCDQDGDDCTGWLAVLWMHSGLAHGSIRWINPDDVVECAPPSPRLLALAAGVPINAQTIKQLALAVRAGELSENYIDKAEARFAEPEAAKPQLPYVALLRPMGE